MCITLKGENPFSGLIAFDLIWVPWYPLFSGVNFYKLIFNKTTEGSSQGGSLRSLWPGQRKSMFMHEKNGRTNSLWRRNPAQSLFPPLPGVPSRYRWISSSWLRCRTMSQLPWADLVLPMRGWGSIPFFNRQSVVDTAAQSSARVSCPW